MNTVYILLKMGKRPTKIKIILNNFLKENSLNTLRKQNEWKTLKMITQKSLKYSISREQVSKQT